MLNLHFRKMDPSGMQDGVEGRENGIDTAQKVVVGPSKKAEHVKIWK